MDLEKAVV